MKRTSARAVERKAARAARAAAIAAEAKKTKRRRSRNVALGAVGVVAVGGLVTLAAVEDKRCVDASNRVVADANCSSGHGGVYRWYYGGTASNGKVSGGSYERGGFGRFFGGGHGG